MKWGDMEIKPNNMHKAPTWCKSQVSRLSRYELQGHVLRSKPDSGWGIWCPKYSRSEFCHTHSLPSMYAPCFPSCIPLKWIQMSQSGGRYKNTSSIGPWQNLSMFGMFGNHTFAGPMILTDNNYGRYVSRLGGGFLATPSFEKVDCLSLFSIKPWQGVNKKWCAHSKLFKLKLQQHPTT